MSVESMPREALLELLATRATDGLDPLEEARLPKLLAAEPDLSADYFELAAAAADLAFETPEVPLPAELRESILATALEETSAGPRTTPEPVLAPTATTSDALNVVSFRRETPPAPPRRAVDWTRWGGWLLAAALAGFLVGLRFLTPATPEPAPLEVAPVETAAVPLTALERRDQLIAGATDLRRVTWSPTDHSLATGVTGEVVWSDEAQEGYMTFRGLAWNDPTRRQYQLWVFDAARSDERPVDGGVFDIPATGGDAVDVIVPIDAKLRVEEATLFAVTLERPGGVVVSSREDLVLLAPVA